MVLIISQSHKVSESRLKKAVDYVIKKNIVGKRQRKAFAYMLSKASHRKGFDLTKDEILKCMNGEAETLSESKLYDIGMLIQIYIKKDLDINLFVKECKEGVYHS